MLNVNTILMFLLILVFLSKRDFDADILGNDNPKKEYQKLYLEKRKKEAVENFVYLSEYKKVGEDKTYMAVINANGEQRDLHG